MQGQAAQVQAAYNIRVTAMHGSLRHPVAAVLSLALWPSITAAQQNPSPMVERTRAHERVAELELPGRRLSLEGVLPRPVHIFVPGDVAPSEGTTLLVHFHGAAFIAEQAATAADRDYIVAVVNAGAGSSAYERLFADPTVFDSLLAAVGRTVQAASTAGVYVGTRADQTDRADGTAFGRVVISAFSAGHGAVRALLRVPRHFARIDGALLLDGIHTSYVPAGTVLHDGGSLDHAALEPYTRLARAAMDGDKRVLITHSEVFPGTFASTTETTDYLLAAIRLERTAVLQWGPVGMQQLAEVRAGRLLVMGFAGNSAPDHMDHLHGMHRFLALLDSL
jgi:hypothetical protein